MRSFDNEVRSFTYDGNGNRYSKTMNGQTRYYSYDTSGNIVSEYKRVMVNGVEKSQTLVRYVRDTGGKAISVLQYPEPGTPNPVPTTYYFVYNGHGDVTALTDSSGNVVATYSYDEFGNVISSTGTVYNPLRYAAAHNSYYDSETGLYKMGARYYQPDAGRWLTRDTYKGDKSQPQTQNRYVYVENNPVSKVDPTGNYSYKLTAEEKRLSLKHPIAAYKVKNAAGQATNVTIKTFGWNGEDDQTDAFRHAYWNAILVRRIGLDLTSRFTTAHESETPNGAAKRMDLHNNKEGRKIGSKYKKWLSKKVLKALNRGDLIVIKWVK